jgi:hypothetical protein
MRQGWKETQSSASARMNRSRSCIPESYNKNLFVDGRHEFLREALLISQRGIGQGRYFDVARDDRGAD